MTGKAFRDKAGDRPEPNHSSSLSTDLYALIEAVMDELLPHEEKHAARIVAHLLNSWRVRPQFG